MREDGGLGYLLGFSTGIMMGFALFDPSGSVFDMSKKQVQFQEEFKNACKKKGLRSERQYNGNTIVITLPEGCKAVPVSNQKPK